LPRCGAERSPFKKVSREDDLARITPRASTREEPQRFYDADGVRWRKVIADAKISQQ